MTDCRALCTTASSPPSLGRISKASCNRDCWTTLAKGFANQFRSGLPICALPVSTSRGATLKHYSELGLRVTECTESRNATADSAARIVLLLGHIITFVPPRGDPAIAKCGLPWVKDPRLRIAYLMSSDVGIRAIAMSHTIHHKLKALDVAPGALSQAISEDLLKIASDFVKLLREAMYSKQINQDETVLSIATRIIILALRLVFYMFYKTFWSPY